MLKVKELALLQDYNELVSKKEKGLNATEADAKAFAVQRGYNEEKTNKFVALVLSEEKNGGLSDKETAKLEILGEYVEEVAEVSHSNNICECVPQESDEGEVAEIPADSPDAASGSVNIL